MKNPYQQSHVLGKDGNAHNMSLNRKSASGVGQFSDVTKPMPVEKLVFVRNRAEHVRREAQQREWILSTPWAAILKRVLA
jgi:hypothetical protein